MRRIHISLCTSIKDYVAADGVITAIRRENCSPEALAALAAGQLYQKKTWRVFGNAHLR